MVLTGKVAVILGASSGIGEGLARSLAKEPLKALVLAARREDRLYSLARELGPQVTVRRTDAGVPEEIRSLIDETVRVHGAIDFFFYTAGMIQAPTPTEHVTPEFWKTITEVNLIAPGTVASYLAPVFYGQHHGIYLVISSIAGRNVFAEEGPYSATKAGLDHFIRSFDKELESHRRNGQEIYAFAVGPGLVRTVEARKQFPDIPEEVWSRVPSSEQFGAHLVDIIKYPRSVFETFGPVQHVETVTF